MMLINSGFYLNLYNHYAQKTLLVGYHFSCQNGTLQLNFLPKI